MIPKIIHYCWFSKENPPKYPGIVKSCIREWKKLMPDWKFMEWNFNNFDPSISDFTKEASQFGISAYPYISDYTRLWALYKYGGIYLDADQKIIKPLNEFRNELLFFGMINPGEIGCGIIGAEPRNIVIEQLLDEYNQRHYLVDGKPKQENSVYVFTDTLKKYYQFETNPNLKQELDRFTIYPKDVFYPDPEPTENTVGIHLGMTSHYRMVSVVMPVWNGERYIKEAIDSVLNQSMKNFELIIVNDGSTDRTKDIIKSYTDDRIVYLENKNNQGISSALNYGIRSSIGLYIARMDADDIMLPDRLKIQFETMQADRTIDILGTGFEWGNGKEEKEYFKPYTGEIDKAKLLKYGNLLGHTTVMFRKSTLPENPYESYYNGAEDFKLWISSLKKGKTVKNIEDITMIYRQHPEQTKESKVWNITQRIINSEERKNNTTTELSCIVSFKNEGDEVRKTVESIRATSNSNIILIDDCSDDNYDYKTISDYYGCTYFKNTKQSLGVARARDLGVELCDTEYFVLLDGHMRFYDDNWDLRLIKHLKEHPQSIITSNSSIITKEEDYINEDARETKLGGSMGARINMTEPGWEYSEKWTGISDIKNYQDNLSQCSCVLGAFYATNKTWWNWIGGLKGLRGWGGDEPLMSIKTYMAGGECLILRDFFVGHLYRGKAPYSTYNSDVDSNRLFLIYLFTPEDKVEIFENNLKRRLGDTKFYAAKKKLEQRWEEIEQAKKDYEKIKKITWEDWYKINNKYE